MHQKRETQSLEIHRRIAELLIPDSGRVLSKARLISKIGSKREIPLPADPPTKSDLLFSKR
jgi:hypothetical protein